MLLLVVVLTALAGVGFFKTKPTYGLDVVGGSRLTYQMDLAKVKADKTISLETVRQNTLKVMEDRVGKGLGVVDGVVQLKGDDQIIAELPGISNLEAAEKVIGSSASIKLYHAKTVKTEKASYRKYEVDRTFKSPESSPEVHFVTRTGQKLAPSDPGYKDMIDSWDLVLEGDDLESAGSIPYGNGYQPRMNFSAKGADKLEKFSKKVENQGEMIAFVLDNRVISIAGIKDNTILSDNAVIDGSFTAEYVTGLASLLNSGALPVDLKELSKEQVDPTIGLVAKDQMVTSGLIAFGLICAFLLLYYGWPGFVATIALVLYCLFTLTVMKLIGATFSLAAIAGFILSVGMAVDANILVFERFKEEFAAGRKLLTAMELGFKRALPAIIDSNSCTVLTSFVLMYLGTGSVKGFATSLILGVVISLFTAVTVSRTLLVVSADTIATNEKWYALHRQWFKRIDNKDGYEPLQVVNKAKLWFTISTITILPGILFAFLGGFKPNVEFRGGYEAQYSVKGGITSNDIIANLTKNGFAGSNVKTSHINNDTIAIISIPENAQLQGAETSAAVSKIAAAAGLDAKDSRGYNQIGPAIQKETLYNAVEGVIISSALIIIFLAFRFGMSLGGFVPGLRFGLSAIGALIHDIFFVLAFAGAVGFFLHWEISALYITSMLTIIGFSVHDTIVVFDRIRENLRRNPTGETLEHLMNKSITQSFARSINTSMTVIVTLAILGFFGTPTADLKFFVFAMLAGIISGTYSSIYNASPILYLWDKSVVKRKGEEAGLVGIAQAELVNARRLAAGQSVAMPSMPAPAPKPKPTPKPTPKPEESNGEVSAEEKKGTDGKTQRTYGQVKRRANQPKPGHYELDEDP